MRKRMLLVGLFTIVLMANGFSQKPAKLAPVRYSHADSLLIRNYIRYVKVHFFDHSEIAVDTTSDMAVDDIWKQFNMSVDGANVYYAPDSMVKIIQVGYSVCGANCSRALQTFVFLKSGKVILGGDIFMEINAVYNLPGKKYLVTHGMMEPQKGCPNRYMNATVFGVQHDSVVVHPFTYKRFYREDDPIDLEGNERAQYFKKVNAEQQVSSLSFASAAPADSAYLTFNPKTMRLSYRYFNACSGQSNGDVMYSGHFDYKGDRFVEGIETMTKVEPVMDK